ncbi:hypothetical protein PGB90_005849 [Kerria lacca]
MATQEDKNLRLKRSKSLNQADDFRKCEEIVRQLQPDKPCHKYQDSLFSWSSGFNDFNGFVNWAFVLLMMGGIRLLLENLLKYGIRIDPNVWLLLLFGGNGKEHNAALLLLTFVSYSYYMIRKLKFGFISDGIVPIFLSLFIEKAMAKRIFSENIGFAIQIINITYVIILPMILITTYSKRFGLLGATTVCMTYSIIFLKLWSYIQVNMWCRKQRNEKLLHKMKESVSFSNCLHKEKSSNNKGVNEVNLHLVIYPDNLNIQDIVYFMFIPTLCYELNFPRTDRIRKRFIVKRILELIIGVHVLAALFQQWIIPSVKHSLIPFTNMDILKSIERMLKLSIPNHLLWLVMFYLLFHSWLNFIGEIFHFADRNFYLDWWNATNSNVFWRKWNTVVHRWALRHVYLPMVDIGYSKFVASTAVFFISAFFHEFLVSVPLGIFRSWAFVGMMLQIPLSSVSMYMEKHYGPRLGNVTVWLSLILGQPLCIMMYYHDYVISHYGKALIEQFGHL